jgi:hypothetical protein
MKILIGFLCLSILSPAIGMAQDVWRQVPTVPRGPWDPDTIGTAGGAYMVWMYATRHRTHPVGRHLNGSQVAHRFIFKPATPLGGL